MPLSPTHSHHSGGRSPHSQSRAAANPFRASLQRSNSTDELMDNVVVIDGAARPYNIEEPAAAQRYNSGSRPGAGARSIRSVMTANSAHTLRSPPPSLIMTDLRAGPTPSVTSGKSLQGDKKSLHSTGWATYDRSLGAAGGSSFAGDGQWDDESIHNVEMEVAPGAYGGDGGGGTWSRHTASSRRQSRSRYLSMDRKAALKRRRIRFWIYALAFILGVAAIICATIYFVFVKPNGGSGSGGGGGSGSPNSGPPPPTSPYTLLSAPNNEPIFGVKLSPNGQYLFGAANSLIYRWRTADLALIDVFAQIQPDQIVTGSRSGLSFDVLDSALYIISADGKTLLLHDLTSIPSTPSTPLRNNTTPRELPVRGAPPNPASTGSGNLVAHDNATLYTVTSSGALYRLIVDPTLDFASYAPPSSFPSMSTLGLSSSGNTALTLTPDGRLLLASDDKLVLLPLDLSPSSSAIAPNSTILHPAAPAGSATGAVLLSSNAVVTSSGAVIVAVVPSNPPASGVTGFKRPGWVLSFDPKAPETQSVLFTGWVDALGLGDDGWLYMGSNQNYNVTRVPVAGGAGGGGGVSGPQYVVDWTSAAPMAVDKGGRVFVPTSIMQNGNGGIYVATP
ncbi:hypothetical protein HK101_008500 [Irineochytrium annulatum]|nr:hypothetical protein HK101_008500 [Irineochytrium annulatum]